MSILKSLNFGGNEVLQRNQMKSVLGGSAIVSVDGGNSGCKSGVLCTEDSDCNDGGGATACFCGTTSIVF